MPKPKHSAIVFSLALLAVIVITGLMRRLFHDAPPPSFADLYLIAVLVLAYRYSWKLAAALAGVSLLLTAYVLMPLQRVARVEIGSYAVCLAVVIFVVADLQRRRI